MAEQTVSVPVKIQVQSSPSSEPKSGHKTTEFYVSLVGMAVPLVSMVLGQLSPTYASLVIGGVAGLYALARSIVKQAHAAGLLRQVPSLPDIPQLDQPGAPK